MNKTIERAKKHLIQFDGYWINVLEVKLYNARNLIDVKGANSKCKNKIIIELVNSYINYSIELALIKIYETLEFIGILDNTWSTLNHNNREGMSEELRKIVNCRNKLVVHIHQNEGKETRTALEDEFKNTNFKIIELILNCHDEISIKIEELKIGTTEYSNPLICEFDVEELEKLVLVPASL
jgi:hypothetical protein